MRELQEQLFCAGLLKFHGCLPVFSGAFDVDVSRNAHAGNVVAGGAGSAHADDQHVAIDGFGDLCDRLGRLHERRQPVGGRGAVARNADSTVGIRRVLLVAARGKRAGAQRAQRGNAAKLQEITARRGPSLCFQSFSPLRRTFLGPARVREFRRPEKPLAKPNSTLRTPGVPR